MTSETREFRIAAFAMLTLLGVLGGSSMLRQSVTYDEVANLGAGLSYVQKLDLRLNGEHPPLPKILAAVPLAAAGARADYTHESWRISEPFFTAYSGQLYFGEMVLNHWNEPRRTLALARVPMLGLLLLLGWLVYACARRLGGEWGGLLSLCLYSGAPALLGFGLLVHEDLAIAAFSLLTLLALARLHQGTCARSIALFALSLAAAFLSKFSAGVLLIAVAMILLSAREFRRNWRGVALGVVCAAVVVYVFYFVFSWNQPCGGGLDERLWLPVRLYLRGLYFVLLFSSRSTVLLGYAYPHGVWFYFPVLLCLKAAPGFLVVMLMAAVTAIARKVRHGASVIASDDQLLWRSLWITAMLFAAVCMSSRLNIGIRHFSVPMVLMIVLVAPLPRLLTGRLSLIVAGGAAVSCLLTAILAWPHYLPYRNIFTTGRPAYALFNDSNLDWGQALPEVERFAAEHGQSSIAVDFYGFTNTTPWISRARLWNCQAPAPEDAGQWVVVSANMMLDVRNCVGLLKYPHEELGGGAMYAVHLPVPAPDPPAIKRAFLEGPGGVDARRWFVDLTRDPSIVTRTSSEGGRAVEAWSAAWCGQRFPHSPGVCRWVARLTR